MLSKIKQESATRATARCADCKVDSRFVSSHRCGSWYHTCLVCGRNYIDGVRQVFATRGTQARALSIAFATGETK
jgi:hypothetical protein